MPKKNLPMLQDIKQVYLYLICLVTIVVAMWGVIDLISGSFHLLTVGTYSKVPDIASTQYFQRQMILNRITDGFARAAIGGMIFAYFSLKLKKYEGE